MRHTRNKIFGGWLVAATLMLSACGSQSSGSSPAGGGGGRTGSSDGVLRVLADGIYTPYEFLDKDGHTMHGLEVEMLAAISKKLGVKVEYQNMQFDAMIPALANGRADLMIMAMADTPARRKQVDFIDLYKTTYRVVTRAGNPAHLHLGADQAHLDLTNLCGHSAAVTTGSQQEQEAKILNETCAKAGKPSIKIQAYTQTSQEYLAVKNGRADFDMFVPANGAYFVKTTPGYELLPYSFPNPEARYTGWIVAKNNKALQGKLLRVINELINDGTWGKLLAKWGVSKTDAVIPPLLNSRPAPSAR
ncbi:ABC transporter substrate-binding protein [Streptomyces sp. NPDC001393]